MASAPCASTIWSPRQKRSLFARVREALAPGGRFVLADVVVPMPATPYLADPGFDRPDSLADQLTWLQEAGFAGMRVAWTHRDLAVVVADRP